MAFNIKKKTMKRINKVRGIAIKEKNLFVGPVRDEKEVKFWEEQLSRNKTKYLLIHAEGTVDDGFFKGYLFFTDTL